MQIKELSKKLNITQKTIRYYEQQGLIQPDIEEKNGRNFRDYSEEEIKKLEAIILLRQHYFTVEEIRKIFESPEHIEKIYTERKDNLYQQLQRDQFIYESMKNVRLCKEPDIYSLANALRDSDRKIRILHQEWNSVYEKLDQEFSEDSIVKLEKEKERMRRASDKMFCVLSSRNVRERTSGDMFGWY